MNDKQGIFSRSGQAGREQSRIVRKPVAGAADILDPDWGHLTIKISGHPPFAAQLILNGHEYVACQARKTGIAFTKEGNCFTTISDAAGLAKIADTLSEQRAIGRLSQVCERWIYTCVCFALDFDD
jgi:hypothetical protein